MIEKTLIDKNGKISNYKFVLFMDSFDNCLKVLIYQDGKIYDRFCFSYEYLVNEVCNSLELCPVEFFEEGGKK